MNVFVHSVAVSVYIECLCVFYLQYIIDMKWYLVAVFLTFRVVLKCSVGISTTTALCLVNDSLMLATGTAVYANR